MGLLGGFRLGCFLFRLPLAALLLESILLAIQFERPGIQVVLELIELTGLVGKCLPASVEFVVPSCRLIDVRPIDGSRGKRGTWRLVGLTKVWLGPLGSVEHLELDRSDTQSVAGMQGGVCERPAVEPCVHGPAADHRDGSPTEDQAM